MILLHFHPYPPEPRPASNFAQDDRGSAVIEMAVTLPLLFTLLFCFIEMCLAFYTYDMISESAREGTRYAMYRGSSCPTSASPTCEATHTQVETYVNSLGWPNLAGGTLTTAACYIASGTTTCLPTGSEAPGGTVQVTVTYTFRITMPFVPTSALSMTAVSQMPIIQ